MTESVHRFRTMVYEIEVLMCTGHEWYWSDLSTHSHGVSWVNLVQPTKGGSIMVHTVKNLLRTKNCACYETEWDSNSTMVMADNHTISTQILHSPNGELMSMLGMNMMWKSLEIFHMSSEIRATLKKYVVGFLLHFSTSAFTTGWINHHVGIAMGCMILPILFIMAMQIILDVASSHTLGPSLNKEVTLTAFMNDTMILTPDVSYAEDMLAHLDKLISWCRMRFKPKKFRTCPSLRARWQQRHSPSQGRPSLRWWTHLVNSLSRVYNKKMQ